MKYLLKLLGLKTTPIREISSFGLNFNWNIAGLILILLVTVPLTFLTYKFEGKNINKKRKRTVLLLRVVWIVILSFLLAGPHLAISGLIPEKNKIAVLLDTSKSMSIKTSSSPSNQETRLDQMKKVFEGGFLKKIEDKLDTYPEVFSFSESVSPASKHEISTFNFKPEGNHTNISGAITNITNNLGDSNLIGIIMLTDGTRTMGENPLFTSQNIKTPLYFIAPDDENEGSDLGIVLINPPSIGYLNSNIRIKGELSRYKVKENKIEVGVMENSKAIATITVTFDEQASKTDFYFNIPCSKEGSYRYDFTIADELNELTSDNNTDGFLLKVVKERLNVIALSGKPSLDIKFIGNALTTDPNINFTQYSKVFNNHWISATNQEPLSGVNKQLNPGMLDDKDILILTDVEYNDIKNIEKSITTSLESGQLGLWVLSSHRSFNELGYRNSEILKTLPIEIATEQLIKTGANLILPNRDTEYNFLKLLDDPIQNQSFFSLLPKLEGIYRFSRVKPGAEILLSTNIEKAGEKLPFMIKSQYGRGNIILTTGGPIWSFGFRLIPSNHGMSPYIAMVTNMTKMLANRREDASVSIELPYSRGFTEQATSIKVWVADHKRQLVQNAQVTLTISDGKNSSNQLNCIETSEKGCYEAIFIPTNKGIHKLKAKARFQSKDLGEAESEILIETSTAEFNNPEVSYEVMKKIAAETGGLCVSSKDANKIVDAIKTTPGKKLITKQIDLRDSWFLLLALLILPCIEWYIRRMGGLS